MIHLDAVEQLWSRLFREVATHGFALPTHFQQSSFQVSLSADPAIQAIVAAHLHYVHSSTANADWHVFCLVRPLFWDASISILDIGFTPCLDYGGAGYIAQTTFGNLILSRNTRGAIAVDHAEKRISVVANSSGGAFIDSYKVIRQLFAETAFSKGAVPLHASAVACNGSGVAFVGKKGAGKSTALLHALSSRIPGMSYLADDRVLIRRDGDSLFGMAWPTVAGFGGGALSRIKGISDILNPPFHLKGGGIAYLLLDLPLIQSVGDREHPQSVPDKIRLTPREIETLFQVKTASESPITLLVYVQLKLSLARSEVNEVTAAEEKKALMLNHIEREFANHPSWLGISEINSAERIDRNIRHWGGMNQPKCRVLSMLAGRDFHDSVRGLCAVTMAGSGRSAPQPRWHFGVYAIVIKEARILVVQKARGPYKGLLDLPGGAPEPFESLDSAITRELLEETGGRPTLMGPWRSFDIFVQQSSSGEEIQFRHAGLWRYVVLMGVEERRGVLEDVAGIQWLALNNWNQRCDLSAPLQEVLRELPAYLSDFGVSDGV